MAATEDVAGKRGSKNREKDRNHKLIIGASVVAAAGVIYLLARRSESSRQANSSQTAVSPSALSGYGAPTGAQIQPLIIDGMNGLSANSASSGSSLPPGSSLFSPTTPVAPTSTPAPGIAATNPQQQWLTSVYQSVLGRSPDPSGDAYWLSRLNSGESTGQVLQQIEGSPEAHRAIASGVALPPPQAPPPGAPPGSSSGASPQQQWLTSVYQSVLGRSPDPSGDAYWLSRLNSGESTGQVLQQIEGSSEARRDAANGVSLIPTPAQTPVGAPPGSSLNTGVF